MNLKKIIRNYFGFSRVETNGFLVLIPLMLLILFSEPLYRKWIRSQSPDYSHEKKYLDSLVTTWEKNPQGSDSVKYAPAREFFAFDPNKTSKEEFQTLGFSERLAARIVNYVEKGGQFRIKKDLLKIYGIDSLLYAEVEPFISLPETYTSSAPVAPFAKVLEKKKPNPVSFNLNTADTSQLKTIYGIGEKLSLRIIKYRESLGGFINEEQLKEVFGLDSIVIQKILKQSFIEENFSPVKLDVNTATEEALDKHPYLNRKEVKAIIAYRFQHGKFKGVDDLNKILLLDKKTIEKVTPYLSAD